MPITLPPQYKLTQGTSFAEDTGVAVDKTDDGAGASRALYAKSHFDIDAEFLPLLAAEHAAFMLFLRTNSAEEIDLTIDGQAYRCRTVRAPSVKFVGGLYRQVSCAFRGYAL